MAIPYELRGLADVALFLGASVACAFHLTSFSDFKRQPIACGAGP
jgi:hypothetical protein